MLMIGFTMKNLLNFSYVTIFALLVGITQTGSLQAADLPHFKKHESYSSVRSKMIKSGWKPFHAENADTCTDGDSRCKGRPEMEFCASTGMANCKFLWKQNEEKTAICTIGEVDAIYAGVCN